MAWGYDQYAPYVPVAVRRANAARELAKRAKKRGRPADPVRIDGRLIARTFWGKAWCENLERYSDYANRLPRGRTYARNGSVVDLHVAPGKVSALVAGSELYEIEITIERLEARRWQGVIGECSGKIASLIGLLRGELSDDVLTVLTRAGAGLFPGPREIALSCSCPDSAGMCKHIAATLYGVGARLDARPELFFALRQVDQAQLIAGAASADVLASVGGSGATTRSGKKRLAASALAGVFGIELDADVAPAAAAPKPRKKTAAAAKKAPAATAAHKPRRKAK